MAVNLTHTQNCLYVGRLTRNVNNDHLTEIFGFYGTVVRAEISVDKRNGVSKGHAVVQFANQKDAENALIYLNGGQIDGKVIEVTDKLSNQDVERSKGNITGRLVMQRDPTVDDKGGKNGKVGKEKPIRLQPNDGSNTNDGKVELGKRSRQSRSRSWTRHGEAGAPPEGGAGAAKKYVPKERTADDAARQTRQSRSKTRDIAGADSRRGGDVPVSRARADSRDMNRGGRGARGDSRDRGGRAPGGAGGAGARGVPARRADSRDRGLSRYGPASGPAPAARRGGNAPNLSVYGPAGGTARGDGRGRPGASRYVPVDRTRGRSRSRSPVRAGFRRARDSRSRSRSAPRRGPARGRSPVRRSYSRSRSRSRSSESGYRRRARRSHSTASSSERSYRRSRSYSRSTRSSRSPSRSVSRSRSRSVSRSRSYSRSRSVSASRSRSRSPVNAARARSPSRSASK